MLILSDSRTGAPGRDRSATHAPILALAGAGGHSGRLLAALAPLLEQGGHIWCLDGGNVFRPDRLAERARAAGRPPEVWLERVHVSRAYTCHQLVEAADALLPPLVEVAELRLAVVLGADRLFLDDDLPLAERRHLYGRLMRRTEALGRAGLPLMITVLGERPSPWVRALTGRALLIEDPARALSHLLGPPTS